MDTYLLGIDAGTTSMKAVLFDERGRAVASALEEYRLLTPAPEIVELEGHPWFIGVQFHPELKSKPFEPHPLFASFIEAAVAQSRLV